MKLYEMAEWGIRNSGKNHPLDAMLDGYDHMVADHEIGVDPEQFKQFAVHPLNGNERPVSYIVNSLWRMDSWGLKRIYYWLKALDI